MEKNVIKKINRESAKVTILIAELVIFYILFHENI